jgi:hypothetical protein
MLKSPREGVPKPGDVILRRARDGSHRYTLSTSGSAPQVLCHADDEAIRNAERFAQSHHVDVWQTADDRSFTRIFACRSAIPG